MTEKIINKISCQKSIMLSSVTDCCAVSWFNFANARRDGDMKCSPSERLDAIYRYFAWCREQNITVIGCSEANRTQNDMDWPSFYANVEDRYGYKLLTIVVQGDKNPTAAFGLAVLVDKKIMDDDDECVTTGEVQLTPDACQGTRWAVLAASLRFKRHKFLYCQLSLSVNGQDEAYDNLVFELKKIASEYIKEGWIAFGDFNLTRESRKRLLLEEPALVEALKFAFGNDDDNLSFMTFPHDTIPLCAFQDKTDHILRTTEEGDRINVVSALDAVCGSGIVRVSRFLPYGAFKEIPLDWSVKQVAQYVTERDVPSLEVADWASDHWLMKFECVIACK